MKSVHRLDSLLSPSGVELATSQGRVRPDITNHCWQNEASERWLLESLRASAGDQCFTMPRGDGAILQGVPRGRIVEDMIRKGISVSVNEVPRTWADFSKAVAAAAGEKKRSFFGMQPVCTFDELRAVENARVCLSQPRERRDDTTIARSIMPFVSKLFCETSITAENKEQVKNTEWFDKDERRWHLFGGEDHLDDVVEDALRSFFTKPVWQFVTQVNEYGFLTTSLRPVPDPTDGLCGHIDFIKKIRSIVSQLMRTHKMYKSVPLNSLSSKLINFDCGKTLDFSMIEGEDGTDIPRPYEQQQREGMPEDRNTKHTGNKLPPCDQVLHLQIAEVCKLFELAITEWPSFSIEDLDDPASGEAAQKLRDLLRDMMDSGSSKLLGFLYGSQKDLDKVMYELLHYTRCGTGCETFEQFLYFYGKKGSNAKGTRIKFLLKVAGLSSNGGYVGVTKASFFQQAKIPNPNAPDEATAAMEDVKWLLVDEAGSNMTDQGALPQAMNATIMKTSRT
ncbi:unnamed protein product [Polarella glacialis]|uniref:Uncharacterized protein n=1 Tax=Polarella glacialis TaxID=89957 RepID=A0A813G1C5_POLGL|nr:unnamed protein product [Polarella glacialis]